MSDLTAAVTALADLGVHPIGLTIDGSLIALRVSALEQAALLSDEVRRAQIVSSLQSCGFLYVTLNLDSDVPVVE